MSKLTPSENRLKILLQFWMVAFFFATLVFLFWGNRLIEFFNTLSSMFTPFLDPLPTTQEKFWMALVCSLMLTLIFLCYWGQKDLKKYILVIHPILFSKLISTVFFFLFFVFHERSLAYFMGALTDGGVFLITYFFYRTVKP